MKRLSSIRILLAVQILVGLQSGILGIPKLTGLLVGHVVAGLRAFSALRTVCRCPFEYASGEDFERRRYDRRARSGTEASPHSRRAVRDPACVPTYAIAVRRAADAFVLRRRTDFGVRVLRLLGGLRGTAPPLDKIVP